MNNVFAMPEVNRDGPKAVVRDLFPRAIGVFEWQNTDRLNAQLRAAIMKRYETSPSVVQSGRFAWQSEHHIDRWSDPCMAEFVSMVKTASAKMAAHLAPGMDTNAVDGWQVVSCWGNVNPPGGYSNPHHHMETGGILSGVYYVDIGDCDPSYAGRTIFEDHSGAPHPSQPGNDALAREYALVPMPGTACIFPASQMHYVEPYRGKGVRITIAFNLKHPNFNALYYPIMRTPNWWWRNFRGLMILRSKIPEKLRAAAKFAPYLMQEFGHRGSQVSLSSRLKAAYERAQVDAGAKVPDAYAGDRLPDKRPLV